MNSDTHLDNGGAQHSPTHGNKPEDTHVTPEASTGDSTNSAGNVSGKKGVGGGPRRNNNRSPTNRSRGGRNAQGGQERQSNPPHNHGNHHHFSNHNARSPFRRIGPTEAVIFSRRSELLNIIRVEHMKVDIYKSSSDLSPEEREEGIRSARLSFEVAKEEWFTLGAEVAAVAAAAEAEAEAAKGSAAAALAAVAAADSGPVSNQNADSTPVDAQQGDFRGEGGGDVEVTA